MDDSISSTAKDGKGEWRTMINWSDFRSFHWMITPMIIRILFWVGVVVVFLGGIRIAMTENFVGGLVIMVAGPIVVRICSEILIAPFMIYQSLQQENEVPQKKTR